MSPARANQSSAAGGRDAAPDFRALKVCASRSGDAAGVKAWAGSRPGGIPMPGYW